MRILRVGEDGMRLGVTAPPEVPAPANATSDTAIADRLATRLRRNSAVNDVSAEAGRSAAKAETVR